MFGVIGISGAGLAAALVNSYLVSTVAYAVLLVVGCGLLFFRRYDAIATTRSAGGVGALSVQPIEKAAIACLALSCLANGVVIALEVARWTIWLQLREAIL